MKTNDGIVCFQIRSCNRHSGEQNLTTTSILYGNEHEKVLHHFGNIINLFYHTSNFYVWNSWQNLLLKTHNFQVWNKTAFSNRKYELIRHNFWKQCIRHYSILYSTVINLCECKNLAHLWGKFLANPKIMKSTYSRWYMRKDYWL